MNLLIVEDNEDIVKLLSLYLGKEGYHIVTAADGVEGLNQFKHNQIDLCILDIMIPQMNGFELAKRIRLISRVPIIFLSAKTADEDKIHGLNLGADDYITKPFNPLELIARVRSNLRRANEGGTAAKELVCGDITLHFDKLSCIKRGQEVILTPMEYKILSLMMQSPNKVFTKMQIYENVSGDFIESDENTVMVHIFRLREKIEDHPKDPKYIRTIRGLGYKFDPKHGL